MRWLMILLGLASLCLQAQAEERYPLSEGDLRLSYETLTLPGVERMGLIGMGLLIDWGSGQRPYGYGGLSVYGAVTGQRGGFFTGGFSAGLLLPLRADLTLEGGLFIGGGGGAAPQGGGLMLRPHVTIDYQWNDWRWGLGWSRVRFPNGAIDSQQWSLNLTRPLAFRLGSGWLSEASSSPQQAISSRRSLSINQWHYFPRTGTRDTVGVLTTAPMHLLGFTVDIQRQAHRYLSLQTAGALAGNTDGYAEVLWAYGLHYPLTAGLSWRAALAIGAGGGGGVATGGGLLGRATLALDYELSQAVQVALTLGHVTAPRGAFNAELIGLQLIHRYAVPTSFDEKNQGQYQPQHWRLRGAWQSYRPTGDTRRKGQAHADKRAVNLVASKIDWMLTDKVYMTGQAMAAYAGGAGGYAAGQFGLGWRQPLTPRWAVNSELLFGVGGGGGLDVGGGQLVHAMIGLERNIDKRLSVMVSVGRLEATDGALRAKVFDVALVWRLSVPVVHEEWQNLYH